MNGKQWWKSKVVWMNLILVVLSASNEFFKLFEIPADKQALIIGVLNLLLRLFSTNQPINPPPSVTKACKTCATKLRLLFC